jgi:hypothetical protein
MDILLKLWTVSSQLVGKLGDMPKQYLEKEEEGGAAPLLAPAASAVPRSVIRIIS